MISVRISLHLNEAASVISQDKDTRNNHGLMVNTNERTGITTSKFPDAGFASGCCESGG